MKVGLALLCLVVLFAFAAGPAVAVPLPFFDDFENIQPNFYPTINGWHTWQSGSGAYVSNLAAWSGTRAFRLNSYSYWTRADYLSLGIPPARFGYRAAVLMDPFAGREARVGLFQSVSGQTRFYNNFRIQSGDGVVGSVQFDGALGTPPVAVGTFAVGQWITLCAEMDFTTLTADLWLNDTLAAAEVPIQPEVFDLAEFGPVTLDKFGVMEVNWIGGRLGTLYVDDVALYEPQIPTLEATIAFEPPRLKLSSRGRFINGHIELPEGFLPGDIDVGSLLLNGTLTAEPNSAQIGDYDLDGIPDLTVKFDRRELTGLLSPGEQELVISGALADGVPFSGAAVVQVVP